MESIRAYKFYPARWGLEALYRQRLKLSTSRDINDPFEFLAAGRGKASRKSARDIRSKLFADSGIISFCKTWREPLLWSHYAENHGGIALGFDLNPGREFEIIYQKERVLLPANDSEIYIFGERLKFWHAIQRVKFDSWSYEKEVRVFPSINGSIRENGRFFRPFGDIGEIKEVIIGANYKSCGHSELTGNLKNQGVNIITARLAFKNFTVTQQKHRKLQKIL